MSVKDKDLGPNKPDDFADDSVDEPAEGPAGGDESDTARAERERSFSRRALIQAGWAVPVVMAVTPPRAYAQSPVTHTDAGDPHTDTDHTDELSAGHSDETHLDIIGHSDELHTDTHTDSFFPPHIDGTEFGHSDFLHFDGPAPHGDLPDFHTDSGVIHSDSSHSDT